MNAFRGRLRGRSRGTRAELEATRVPALMRGLGPVAPPCLLEQRPVGTYSNDLDANKLTGIVVISFTIEISPLSYFRTLLPENDRASRHL